MKQFPLLYRVFANVFYTNKCFQTYLFFRPGGEHFNQSKLEISGLCLGFSSCMQIHLYVQHVIPLVCRQNDLLLLLPARTIVKTGLNAFCLAEVII